MDFKDKLMILNKFSLNEEKSKNLEKTLTKEKKKHHK